jgi:hypothetical protein
MTGSFGVHFVSGNRELGTGNCLLDFRKRAFQVIDHIDLRCIHTVFLCKVTRHPISEVDEIDALFKLGAPFGPQLIYMRRILLKNFFIDFDPGL